MVAPLKGDGTIFAELVDLGDPDSNLRVATKPAQLTRPLLSLEWSGMADDAVNVFGPVSSSLGPPSSNSRAWFRLAASAPRE